MADNTAHDTPGPGSDTAASAVPVGTTAATERQGDAAAAEVSIPSFAEYASASAFDVELVGRSTAPRAQLGDIAKTPVLVGAAAGTSARDAGGTDVISPREAGSQPGLAAARDRGGDLPVWSFGEAGARTEAASPAAAPANRNQVELPFTPAAEPTKPVDLGARAQPLFGPIGQPRSAFAVVLLSVVTLGVYALVWQHRLNRELDQFDAKLHSRPARTTIALAIPWVFGALVTAAGAALVIGARLSLHLPLASHLTSAQAYYLLGGLVAVPYLTLLLPFSLAALVMNLERLRCVEEHVGTTTDRQVRAVGSSMMLAIPVIGGLVLLAMTQRRVNAIWDAVAPAERPSR